jgi:DNA-binding MarR family transcriptional regulator
MPGRHRLRTPALVARETPLDRIRHEHLGWLLAQGDRLFAEGVTRAINARGYRGIRLVHIALIRNVEEGGTRITEIARRAGMTKQATGQLVREFVELGYIRVVADPADGRVKIARYTAKGKRLLRAVVDAIATTEREFTVFLSADDAAFLKETLTRLLAAEPTAG